MGCCGLWAVAAFPKIQATWEGIALAQWLCLPQGWSLTSLKTTGRLITASEGLEKTLTTRRIATAEPGKAGVVASAGGALASFLLEDHLRSYSNAPPNSISDRQPDLCRGPSW